MNKETKTINHIVNWLKDYAEKSNKAGFVIGISGGIDSAVVSTLCAMTKLETFCIQMPINNQSTELSLKHIYWLIDDQRTNITYAKYDLTKSYEELLIWKHNAVDTKTKELAQANLQARLRMTTLYYWAQLDNLLVCGTGNKVEDYGIGFFTKYGDGGVDISPIGDLLKSEVYAIGKELGIIDEILKAKPTDGLWEDGRTDEDQIGATYDELEWVMEWQQSILKGCPIEGNPDMGELNKRQTEILQIYNKLHNANRHKMTPIPICEIPQQL